MIPIKTNFRPLGVTKKHEETNITYVVMNPQPSLQGGDIPKRLYFSTLETGPNRPKTL